MTFDLAIGPRVRKSPYFAATVAAGVTAFNVYNHMYMPVSYGDQMGEYERLINGVAMWDVAVERQVQLAGKDAGQLAALITTRAIEDMEIGQGRYAPICDQNGILLNDPILLKLSEELYWFSIADRDILLWAQAIAASKGLDVKITEPDVSPLAVQGPKADNVIADIFGDWINEIGHFWFKEQAISGIPVILARSGWSRQGGFELYLQDGSRGQELWNIVYEAGRKYDIGPGAPNYIERVESALLSIGADTDDRTNPFEVGLGRFVDLDREDDFFGKSALRQIASSGPSRCQVGLLVDGAKLSPNPHPYPVFANGEDAGFVSATAWSPRLGNNIALALVQTGIEDGAELEIDLDGDRRKAKVTGLPFL